MQCCHSAWYLQSMTGDAKTAASGLVRNLSDNRLVDAKCCGYALILLNIATHFRSASRSSRSKLRWVKIKAEYASNALSRICNLTGAILAVATGGAKVSKALYDFASDVELAQRDVRMVATDFKTFEQVSCGARTTRLSKLCTLCDAEGRRVPLCIHQIPRSNMQQPSAKVSMKVTPMEEQRSSGPVWHAK
jgi:hypothetical protein